MGLQEILSRFNRLQELIEQESTGSPEDLAETLGVSKRQLLNYIIALKNESDQSIIYDRSIQSYKFMNGNATEMD
ncbi:hypothetical protein JMN32_07740 [Fulvivirga sp. 29W222]|uniref:Helix-turn-helix type 11 domain-containing protein n=1 Tax=Fulvivirga marina TaxID=2494733 RepID=A0A937KDL8_9BACT|nr:hypothetical protein [Fulvivirga marina]MBL6446195.1 hypothetical protein [Fulvivirga marina]